MPPGTLQGLVLAPWLPQHQGAGHLPFKQTTWPTGQCGLQSCPDPRPQPTSSRRPRQGCGWEPCLCPGQPRTQASGLLSAASSSVKGNSENIGNEPPQPAVAGRFALTRAELSHRGHRCGPGACAYTCIRWLEGDAAAHASRASSTWRPQSKTGASREGIARGSKATLPGDAACALSHAPGSRGPHRDHGHRLPWISVRICLLTRVLRRPGYGSVPMPASW